MPWSKSGVRIPSPAYHEGPEQSGLSTFLVPGNVPHFGSQSSESHIGPTSLAAPGRRPTDSCLLVRGMRDAGIVMGQKEDSGKRILFSGRVDGPYSLGSTGRSIDELNVEIKEMSKWDGTLKFLPSKTCPECKSAFRWSKKWARCWHRIVYCSPECRQSARDKCRNKDRGVAE